ncbi:MAG: ATP-binding protein, partial [Fluviicola sp.]
PEELKGKDALEIFVDEAGKNIVISEGEKRKKGIPSVYEIELIRKDKSKVWVLISGAPFYNEKNEIAGTVGIHVDISERKRMESELISAKEIAENSLKSKDVFVANMSHEIRTPLNAILGMSQLLQNSGLTDRQHKYVDAIHTSSENLLTIVNDLLDFAKIESGKMELDISANNLNKIIQNVIQLWNLKIDQKGLMFFKDIDIPEKAYYLFDSTRLFGILNNLIHNALKFTSHGYISLEVSIVYLNQEEDEIHFSIEDTGIGISNEKQEIIFESFIQAENSTSRNFGGTGLGLAIVKELINKMNGKIEVLSELNKGSTFSFKIPLKKCISPAEIKEKSIQSDFLKNKTVLLVEDNEINRFMAQTILESWNMQVFIAENGAIAVEFLTTNSVDVVLMDMQMPILDGVQATWMIRNKLNLKVPIIALTANASQTEKEKCLDAGMNLYLSKPYKQEELLEVFAETFEDKIEYITVSNKPNLKENTLSLVDLSLLVQNTNSDKVFMEKMLNLVISETEKKSAEIKELLTCKNYDAIKRIAHSMKPSLDHVSKKEIRNLVREVESFPNSEVPESLVNSLVRLLDQLVDQLKEVII